MLKNLLLITITIVFFSCETDGGSRLESKNLIEYGVPFTIQVPNPDSIIVDKDDLGPIEDITIDAGEGYFLQIYASVAESNDVARLKAEQLKLVKEQPYFSQVISEEESGFIFENAIDSTSNFGFRYIQVKGDREYIFQNHLSQLFTLEQVQVMYDAIKPQN